ncbi:hypothetical protein [Aurantiacibacter sp. MUD61]|uniref:hypothetical protein n=1 Tax=Aurantiacibacter sp. MUD61 TaxID=3009083 RepID=UPI0022F00790|nr:hypothetical protein [Aurantiacibacter sp. MUD61]
MSAEVRNRNGEIVRRAAVLVGVVLLAACGSADGDSVGETTGVETATSPVTYGLAASCAGRANALIYALNGDEDASAAGEVRPAIVGVTRERLMFIAQSAEQTAITLGLDLAEKMTGDEVSSEISGITRRTNMRRHSAERRGDEARYLEVQSLADSLLDECAAFDPQD